jgi:hypothetical protein
VIGRWPVLESESELREAMDLDPNGAAARVKNS